VTGTENTHGEPTATEAAESAMVLGAVTVRLLRRTSSPQRALAP